MVKKEGEWIYYHDNGSISYIENNLNGERNGVQKSFYISGNIKKINNYINGSENGFGIEYWDSKYNKIKEKGYYIDDIRCGLFSKYD